MDDERTTLLQNMPEIINGAGKRLLYVGASIVRMAMYADFISFGFKTDILEIWPPNIEHLKTFWSNGSLIEGDIRTLDKHISCKYDIILWWHGPEHIKKDELQETLLIMEQYGDLIILGCPSNESFIQGEMYGNKYETHLWNPQTIDFEQFNYKTCIVKRPGASDHITAWKYIKENK